MGCSCSCAIFEAFSSALEWLSKHLFHASGVVHILDDFLFIAPTKEKCQSDLQNFLRMCDFLGVPIAEEKTVGPLPPCNLQASFSIPKIYVFQLVSLF